MAGTWTNLTNSPPAAVATMLLLTDGTVIAQGVSTTQWYRLTPDASGSYANGTWTTLASSAHAPLYYASGVLRDGKVIIAGGEYDFGNAVWLMDVELYDPIANTWTTLPNPAGWANLGDAPACVLPDGRFFVGQVGTRRTAVYDPVTNAWTATANKINSVGEESWSLMPDGTIHAADCSNPPNAEKYVIAADQWVTAAATPQVLVDGISEIGPSVLLPDGRMFIIGATGLTALYTMPAIASQAGTCVAGPSIPAVNPGQPLGAVDAPAAVLPNGKVLFSASPRTIPASFQPPTFFFEFDPLANTITSVPNPTTSNTQCYLGRLLILPNGQILYSCYNTTLSLYTPDGGADTAWIPTITSCPSSVRPGHTYTLSGRQINGLNQGSYYGNDATNATNYPIIRLQSGSAVYYCRTANFSTMGLQTGTVIHSCSFTVPASIPLGSYSITVIANGIASASRSVSVSNKWFKELKGEFKEKIEIVENLKQITDLKQKRVPDIDWKINEDLEIIQRVEEAWLHQVRTLAESVDQAHAELSHTFIGREERPFVGMAEPRVEIVEGRRISAEEAGRAQRKIAFADGRIATMTKEAEEFNQMVHDLHKLGGQELTAVQPTGKAARTRRRDGKKA